MSDDFMLDTDDLQRRMDGAMASLKTEFASLRTGRATASMLEPVYVEAEHPLFVLYTSGSTGRPKGIQHSSGGYL